MSEETFRLVVAGGVILAAVCFLAQAIAVLVLVKYVNQLRAKVEPLADRAVPMMDKLKVTLNELLPRVSEISADAVEISKNAREQVIRVGELLKDFSDRAKVQVARIDGAVEQTVGNVQHASESVKDAVLKPVREVNGVLAGIKTAVSVFSQGRRQSVDHATQDEEMFI